MATSQSPYTESLRGLAELMLSVAGESVSMMKRTAPDRALKLTRQEEWAVYMEFLKILFNLADRVSALHVPVKEHPQFMENLHEQVTTQLKRVLQPALEAGTDEREIVMTIDTAVAESREMYDQYRFLVSEESASKNDMVQRFGKRIAELVGVPGNSHLIAAATLCINAAIPAMQGLLQGQSATECAETRTPIQTSSHGAAMARTETGNEIKLVSVMSSVKGEEVETRWGLHPRFRQDLKREEAQQLTKLMNRVAKILGERYAAVAFSTEWASYHRAGHA